MASPSDNQKLDTWDLYALIILATFAFVLCWKIISQGVMYAADDIWWHVLWLTDFVKELNEGIIYPRWLAHSNYLYGSPTFVFYPPFCFYLGALAQNAFALNSMQATTAVFTLGTFSSGFSFYLLGRLRFGKKAALAGAVMLMTAPFITLDLFFRAAMAELFALTWLPLILLSVDRVQRKSGRILLSSGFFMLALTHVPSLLIYTVTWLTRVVYCTWRTSGGIERLKLNLLYATLGLGCASFFILPMLAEQRYVNIAAILDRVPWEVNLFFSADYKGFYPLPDIAIKSTAIAIIGFAAIVGELRSKKRGWLDLKEPTYWLGGCLLTFFMMTDASAWFWHNIKILQFLQFPWRLMTVNIFCTSILFTICVKELPAAKIKPYLKVLLTILLVVFVGQHLSSDYFITKYRTGLDKPEAYIIMNNAALSVDEFARYEMPKLLQSEEGYPGVPEYTPSLISSAVGMMKSRAHPARGKHLITFLSGAGAVNVTSLGSYEHIFSTQATDHVTFKMRTYYYPAWHLYMDGRPVNLSQANDGQMVIHAPAGKHDFVLRYENTNNFNLGIALSGICAAVFLWLCIKGKTKTI